MKKSLKIVVSVAAAAALFSAGGVGSAVAAKLISGGDIAKNTITAQNLAKNSVGRSELQSGLAQDGANGAAGPAGPAGAQGPAGSSGTLGAVYRVANYSGGGGGRATVACADTDAASQQYTAIAGGARVEVPGQGTNTEPIVSSFPGRMDFSGGPNNNLPKPGRLDGWVVYFGSGAAPSAGNGTLEIWALCVPNTSIAKQVTNY